MDVFIHLSPKSTSPTNAALIVLLLGPISFSVIYAIMMKFGFPSVKQRGLFEFYATTVGDFILLPMSWVFMSLYYKRCACDELLTYPKWPILLTAFLLICFQTYSNMYGTGRDWTLPSLGKINFPGVYHSIFMVFMIYHFFVFIIDHYLISNLMATNKLFFALLIDYWIVINVLTIFMVLAWSDIRYNKPTTNIYFGNAIQVVLWLLFLLFNLSFLAIQVAVYIQYLFIWLVIQFLVWLLIFYFGVYISNNYPFKIRVRTD